MSGQWAKDDIFLFTTYSISGMLSISCFIITLSITNIIILISFSAHCRTVIFGFTVTWHGWWSVDCASVAWKTHFRCACSFTAERLTESTGWTVPCKTVNAEDSPKHCNHMVATLNFGSRLWPRDCKGVSQNYFRNQTTHMLQRHYFLCPALWFYVYVWHNSAMKQTSLVVPL